MTRVLALAGCLSYCTSVHSDDGFIVLASSSHPFHNDDFSEPT